MTHSTTTTTNLQNNPIVAHSFLILLCAPVHDELTEYTSLLLENLPALGGRTILNKFTGPLTYQQLLANLSVNPDDTEIAVIFSGHGEYSSLQGPGAHPGASNYSEAQSSFYDEDSLHLGPTLMFAACCNAAVELGESIRLKTLGRTFIGFDRTIGFVKKGVYADWWVKVLHRVASAMLRDTNVNDLRLLVEQAYADALRYFDPSSGRKNRYGLMMNAYLRKQLESINLIKT